MDSSKSGQIIINEEQLIIKNPFEAIKHGIGFLTEDRKDEGLILDFSIKDNMTLPSTRDFVKMAFSIIKQVIYLVQRLIDRLRIKRGYPDKEVGTLSGGNQQKVVLAKWIGIAPKVLILDEPTRGWGCWS